MQQKKWLRTLGVLHSRVLGYGRRGAALIVATASLTCAGVAAASSYEILHVFTGVSEPFGSLTRDAAGNLYGTTYYGGDLTCLSLTTGCGVVFKLEPNPDGTWKESALHSFKGGVDGANPAAGLVLRAGNLYSTTVWGGVETGFAGHGLVFKLKPNPDGTWTESVLHWFTGGRTEPILLLG
jgi:uncharacterized repeat protein (TIGR03803 family)